jgi:2-(1,2-epoxy-1,2-dihydrophenyl)acetyl-CoA isomerase
VTKELVETQNHGAVLTIRLCSPENRNSLTDELRKQLVDAIELAQRDRAVRSVFLTAEGRTFSSGGDLKVLQKGCDPWSVHRRVQSFSRWLPPLMTIDKPVVVGINGPAVGGGLGLALTGDVLIAAESAKFVSGFFRLGVVPDVGITYQLPRLIGMARAKNFLFSNATFTAQQALDLGLVSKVVPDDELQAAGLAEAARLADGPAEIMGLAKTLLARSFETSLMDMLTFERLGQALAMSNPEFREGLSALLERRRPDFVGAAGAQARSSDAPTSGAPNAA